MELEKTVELGLLLDTYGSLLTNRMKDILTMYVCENLSLQEIGEYFRISKPAVLDAIRMSSQKLINYENSIKMLQLKNEINNLIDKDIVSKDNLKKLIEKY